jgi:hypothetical protein
MEDWDCRICNEKIPAEEIVSGNHLRLMHPEHDFMGTWPDGSVLYWEDPDEDPGTFI